MRTPRSRLLLAGLIACTLAGRTLRGAEPEAPGALQTDPSGWMDIQPAPDLKGWTRVPIPPTNHLGRAQWHVEGDHLICDGDGGHDMLRWDRELGDAIFHTEFRFAPTTNRNYNSGLFIRNSADGGIWHQAQLTANGGYLFGNTLVQGRLQRIKLNPTERRMKPPGEWNTMELTAQGKKLSVRFNGFVTCTYDECEVPRGYIACESEGYRIEFRNLKVKELK